MIPDFTGLVVGDPFPERPNDQTSTMWVQVFEYEHGQCVDRYVTRAAAVRAA